MTLENLANLAEIIGVVAIFVSLVAIYIQQRKDHAFALAESQRDILQRSSELFDELLAQPSRLESVQRCILNYHGSAPRQQAEFTQYMHKIVLLAEQALFMTDTQLINDNSYQKFVSFVALNIGTPGGQEFWENAHLVYGADIVTAIDEYRAENPVDLETFYQVCPFFRPNKSDKPKP